MKVEVQRGWESIQIAGSKSLILTGERLRYIAKWGQWAPIGGITDKKKRITLRVHLLDAIKIVAKQTRAKPFHLSIYLPKKSRGKLKQNMTVISRIEVLQRHK